jgi:hypothetical protein
MEELLVRRSKLKLLVYGVGCNALLIILGVYNFINGLVDNDLIQIIIGVKGTY